MNAIKSASHLIEKDTTTPAAKILGSLVLDLESESDFNFASLYELDIKSFELAVSILKQWRLDRCSGYDGYKREQSSKVYMALDTRHLRAVHVTPVNEQDRAQVLEHCKAVQAITGNNVELAWADEGYTGEQPGQDAKADGIEL